MDADVVVKPLFLFHQRLQRNSQHLRRKKVNAFLRRRNPPQPWSLGASGHNPKSSTPTAVPPQPGQRKAPPQLSQRAPTTSRPNHISPRTQTASPLCLTGRGCQTAPSLIPLFQNSLHPLASAPSSTPSLAPSSYTASAPPPFPSHLRYQLTTPKSIRTALSSLFRVYRPKHCPFSLSIAS